LRRIFETGRADLAQRCFAWQNKLQFAIRPERAAGAVEGAVSDKVTGSGFPAGNGVKADILLIF
jgi:hypothetical protein